MLPNPWYQTPPWTPQAWLYGPPTLSPPIPGPPTPKTPILSPPPLHDSNTSRGGYFHTCIVCFKYTYCYKFSDACKGTHGYCRHCINHFVRLSFGPSSSSFHDDEEKKNGIIDRGRGGVPPTPVSATTTFPPRCCGRPMALPEDALRLVLDADVLHVYLVERARGRLPWRERTHCAVPDCGEWLTAEEAIREDDDDEGGGGEQQQQQQQQGQGKVVRELRKCGRCSERTCTACKRLGTGHLDDDSGKWKKCPVDEDAVRLDSMAGGMEWKRCGGCGVWVERSGGCSHIV